MHLLYVERYMEGADDPHGNPAPTWGVGEALSVWRVAPGVAGETRARGRDVASETLEVSLPIGSTPPGPQDRVLWRGHVWQVDGEPRDFTNGPWGSSFAGVLVTLKRWEG